MSIFERTAQTRTILDDTEKLYCTVENAQNINKHTEYLLRVQRGPSKENRWTVWRRYRDFAALHSSLQPAHIDLPLPPKKLIGNMQPSFIAERHLGLQAYIDEVLKHQIFSQSLQVRNFLDPENYPLNLSEQAIQTVSIALRGDGHYEVMAALPAIGWRIRKHCLIVKDAHTKMSYLLSWQNYGPDRSLCDKDLQTAFKSLLDLSHPHIDPILSIQNLESGVYVIRRLHENGTIKDMLYGTDFSKSYLSKYGSPKVRRPFTTGQIAHYGYQLLSTLKFLHDKGIPHGHIHPGNLTILDQNIQILDLENFLVGVPCLYRPYVVQLRKTCTAEAVDVYCVGRTLYEMAFAKELEGFCCDTFPDQSSEYLVDVLRLCLSSTAVKHGCATLDLLYHPFFTSIPNGITSGDETSPYLKFPLNVKDELRSAVETFETRLKSDQKLVRSAKKEVRIQEILSSEEELRKHKRRARKRESIWKSTSSLGDTVHSRSASTVSSPTPPEPPAEPNGHGGHKHDQSIATPTPSGSTDGRSALLDAICGFDKTRLARVNSH